MTTTPQPQGFWSNRFAFIMAATGAAVGLGNIWKFPYMAGDNGGSAFVMVYLVCVALIGIPAMISEVVLGRMGRQNPVNTMQSLSQKFGRNQNWALLGWLGALTLLIVLSFYSVVAGWSLAYMLRAFKGIFAGQDSAAVLQVWGDFLASPHELLVWHASFMLMTLWVVAKGVRAGIERASKIMMPLLFLVLLCLVVYAAVIGDFRGALSYLFKPDLSQINTKVVIEAMGHAFFTLAVGAGAMLVYGAYVRKEVNLASTVVIIAGLDVMVACLAGMAIFPLVLQFNLTPEAGPGLMFKVLPIAFAKMPGGSIIGGLFFLLLLFTAWTSSLSMAEPLVALLVERCNLTRQRAAILIGLLAWVLGIISALSFNVFATVKIFGRWDLFTATTDLVTNLMLPLGGLGFVIYVAYRMPRSALLQALNLRSRFGFNLWYLINRVITPIAILAILVAGLL